MFTLVGLTAPDGSRVYVDYTDIARVFSDKIPIDAKGDTTVIRLKSDSHGLYVRESPDQVAQAVLAVVQSAQMVTR